MNIKMLSQITGLTVLLTDVFLVVPLLIALYDGQPRNIAAYAVTMVLMAVVGLALVLFSRGGSRSFYAQEGFAATGISWIVLSLFGALPFCLSGEIPNYVDALFEIVSGFTTTGASILSDVEALSRCNLYWRSFSHWLGGMGILVFLLAVVPEARKSAGSGMYLMRAESPGPSVGKLTPHLRQTALILYYLLLLRQFKSVFKNEELRLYAGIAVGAIVLITIDISRMYGSVREALHHAAFQVSSIMTTTGFASVDFEQWPAFSKAVLLALMFVGACAGSTAGGLKVSRVLLLLKSIRRTVRRAIHPRRVQSVRMDGRVVDAAVLNNVNAYLAVYCVILLLSFVVVSVDGYSIGTNLSAVASCFNNVGPGFELVGATGNYGHYSDVSKLVLTADMLLGRLEIFPLLALFSPDTWSRKR